MTLIDYTTIAETALTLIEGTGREITVIRFNQTPADTDYPWEGPADPRSSPDATTDVYATFVSPSQASELGMETVDADLLKRTSDIAIVAPGPTLTFDLSTANEVTDGDITKKILDVQKLKPGATTLLYFLFLAK